MRKPHREFCSLCHEVIRVGFFVPPEVWEAATHLSQRENIICTRCFTAMADERGVEWDRDIQFYATSRVTQERVVAGTEASLRPLWQRSAVPSEDTRRLDRLQALLDRRGEHGFKGCISIGHDDEAKSGDDQTEVNLWAGEDGWSQPWVSSGDSLRAAIDAIPDAAMASRESPDTSGNQNEGEGATRAAHPAETPASRKANHSHEDGR